MNIVITGGTKGIGRAIAELFAEKGFHVAVCARTEADLKAMQADFQQRFPDVQLLTRSVDMRSKQQVLDFAAFIQQEWGPVDVLVNNAGVFIPGALAEEEDGHLELMVETNLYSAYYLTRALLPSMIEHRKGHIFNMCSIASLHAYPNGGSYSISKYALLGFSKNLREETKDQGIRVSSIMPGATWSASWEGVDLPEERLMKAEDVAIAVWSAWSMSPQAVMEDIVLRPQLGDL
jgi:short-subunit dehydrogenase